MKNNLIYTVADVLDRLEKSEQKFKLSDGTYSSRGNSWKYCYQKFKEAYNQKSLPPKEIDNLAQALAVYLSSWGMYRASSFLLNSDYRVHLKPIEIILEYKDLCIDNNLFDDPSKEKQLFGDKGVYIGLESYYKKCKKALGKTFVKNEIPSDTLISKILLGVYGCIPAYDQNFKKGISCWQGCQMLTSKGNAIYGKERGGLKSLKNILETPKLLEELTQYHNIHSEYTFMKVVDMYFFGLGLVVGDDTRKKEAIMKELEKYYFS